MLTKKQWKQVAINILRKIAKDNDDPKTRKLSREVADDMVEEDNDEGSNNVNNRC